MTALLGLNLNIDDSELKDSLRIERAAESLTKASKKYKKVIILSYRGRPDHDDPRLSLKSVVKKLSLESKISIKFLPIDENLEAAKKILDKNEIGVFALENLRFLEGENKNDLKLAKRLAGLGDIFINDDFATAHRKTASNVGITKFIKSVPGDLLKIEIKNLSKVVKNPRKPLVLIIGGAKVGDKLGVMENMIGVADKILLGGGAGNTALKASGAQIGDSIYDDKSLPKIKKLLKTGKIIYPIDCGVDNSSILDIGPHTIEEFSEAIAKAKTIIWAGPLGRFESKKFSNGSFKIAEAIAVSKAFSVVGGGETTTIIKLLKLKDKIGFLSTGGGAMLAYLSGKEMPALKALGL